VVMFLLSAGQELHNTRTLVRTGVRPLGRLQMAERVA